MDTIILYHLSASPLGDNPILVPKIPVNLAHGENKDVPRICCCNSIIGCVRATTPTLFVDANNPRVHRWLYHAIVPVDDVYQPESNEVPDAWFTGEFWVMEPTQFELCWEYVITRQFDLPGLAYTRYMFTAVEDEPVVDAVVSDVVYGEPVAFSIIALDRGRASEAIAYAEENKLCY